MIAVYLAMLETDVDRDKFMKLYESYEKKSLQFDRFYGILSWLTKGGPLSCAG